MTIALILLIVSVLTLFVFIYLKIPALSTLPEKEEKKFFSNTKEKFFFFIKKLKTKFSLHNLLRKLLLFIRRVSSKTEDVIIRWIHKLKR